MLSGITTWLRFVEWKTSRQLLKFQKRTHWEWILNCKSICKMLVLPAEKDDDNENIKRPMHPILTPALYNLNSMLSIGLEGFPL